MGLIGFAGGLGEALGGIGDTMLKNSYASDRQREENDAQTGRAKLIEELRAKNHETFAVNAENRLNARADMKAKQYQEQYDAADTASKGIIGQRMVVPDAGTMTKQAATLDNIEPTTGKPGAYAGQPVTPADMANMPPEARAQYEQAGYLALRPASLIASARSEAARQGGAMPELRKDLMTEEQETRKAETDQKRAEQAAAALAQKEANEQRRFELSMTTQERIAKAAENKGGQKPFTQREAGQISQDAHRIARSLTENLRNPFAEPGADKDGMRDNLKSSILSSTLSQALGNAAQNRQTLNPDEAGSQILGRLNKVDAQVQKKGAEQAKLLFEGDTNWRGKASPSTEKIEALRKGGVPDSALVSPQAFQAYYREQNLGPAFQAEMPNESAASPPSVGRIPSGIQRARDAERAAILQSEIEQKTQDYSQAMASGNRAEADRVTGDLQALKRELSRTNATAPTAPTPAPAPAATAAPVFAPKSLIASAQAQPPQTGRAALLDALGAGGTSSIDRIQAEKATTIEAAAVAIKQAQNQLRGAAQSGDAKEQNLYAKQVQEARDAFDAMLSGMTKQQADKVRQAAGYYS